MGTAELMLGNAPSEFSGQMVDPLRLPEVVFFGSGAFGLPVLRMLANSGRVSLVVSQPDRAAGRGKQMLPTPVSEFALEHGLPLIRPLDCNLPSECEVIRSAFTASVSRAANDGRPQPGPAMVVIAFGQKLLRPLLEGVFAINLHGSLLPRWRGAAPIQRALMAGDQVAGVSVISLADRMDAGMIYAEESLVIGSSQTSGELHDALSQLGPEVISSVLQRWRSGQVQGRSQDESLATRANKLSRADSWVDLHLPAAAVRARINGLNPWPGCEVTVQAAPLMVRRVEECAAHDGTLAIDGRALVEHVPGTLTADGILRCGQGAVRLLEVQAAGGRTMSFLDWARGARLSGPQLVTSESRASS